MDRRRRSVGGRNLFRLHHFFDSGGINSALQGGQHGRTGKGDVNEGACMNGQAKEVLMEGGIYSACIIFLALAE
jgi:hypothetical protein